ncbi:Os05g0268700 [Oryza sativa Japonica Group]|uniref:Os05g0268700 protein n=1 Tax=Oryza sativa subsp. japonica TaxID=39947 RepID=C7J221_ORYSJ|nr:Os05g0268700 [Oryza sativa Japonica Group]|eukprot:NP_001174312.1 Os05g0268700 [Oryza sativa Japonica Group]
MAASGSAARIGHGLALQEVLKEYERLARPV